MMKVYVCFARDGEEVILRCIYKTKEQAKKHVDTMNALSDYEWWYEEERVRE